MTKLRNKILLVLLALCLVACMGIFVACGGDDDKKQETKPVTYTVTVKMDNAAVKGVKVTVKKGSVSFAPKTTGDDGKVEFSLAEANDYTVELADLPENYEVPGGATLSFPSDRNLTVNLAEKFAYKVKLVNPDGTPFTMEGVTVGICTSNDTCRTPVAIDANGLARIETTKEDYHIQILGLPAGYAYECDAKGYSMHRSEEGTYIDQGDENTYNSLSDTVYEQTVTIYPVNVIDFDKLTPLTDAEIAEYNDDYRTITGAKAYKIQATVPAEDTVYYTFAPEYSGTYNLYAIGYNRDIVGYKVNPRFLLGDTAASGSGYSEEHQTLDLNADNQYYINITAKSAQLELEFILTTPVSSKDVITGATTVKAVINEGANAVVALAPTAGASYRLALQGTGAIAQAYDDESAASYEFVDADYKLNSQCEVKFTDDMVGQTLYFAVSVKAEYPAKINVVVTKIQDLSDSVEKVVPTVTLTKFGTQTGKELVDIKLDGTSTSKIIFNETDKYYHYGTADGPLVVVMLTKKLPAGRADFDGPIIYLEKYSWGAIRPYVFDVTPVADKDDLTKGNSYKDYRSLLRGFDEYKSNGPGDQYGIPTDLTDCYAANVNEDGVYPLTKDLKEYLELMVEVGTVYGNLGGDVQGDEWLFACYYYDTYVDPDVIVGEYNYVIEQAADGEWLIEEESDEYALIINKRNTYKIQDYFGNVVETGTWEKTGEAYTFTKDNSNVVYTDVEFDEDEGTIEFYTNDADNGWKFRNQNSDVVDVIVGEYEFVSYTNAFGEKITTKDAYTLTVNNDGTFMVYELVDDEKLDVYSNLGEWNYKSGSCTFTIPYGVWDDDAEDYADLVFTVDYNVGTGALKLVGSDTSEWEFKKDGDAFVGLYELVSFTDGDEVVSVGDTYQETVITKDYMGLYVVGNTVEFTSQRTSYEEFVGTWTRTVGGKYIVSFTSWGMTSACTARYNKVNNTVTLVIGDSDNGYTTYVFQKKASQAIDAIVGEYYATKKSDFGEETTVADGDFRSDEYKLEVRASGKFAILAYGYPDYEVMYDDTATGTWEKTADGYAFTFYEFYDRELIATPYEVTVNDDLTEIALAVEDYGLGWWFAKAELEAPVAPDAIVGEYMFVIKVNSDGEVSKAGDSYTNRFTGEEVNITSEEYHLVVLKNGRYVILKFEDGVYVTETLGLWSKDGDEYTFYDPANQDAATYGDLVYAVEYNEVIGRVVLISENNGAWIFQKYEAESIEAVDEDENGIYTITVDEDDYTVYTFGSADLNLVSENGDARLCMFFGNGGIKFYYHSEDGDVLAAIAYSEGAEIGPIPMEIVWKLDTVKSAAAVASMEQDEEGEEGEGRYIITVTVTAADDNVTSYRFDLTEYL